MQLTRACRTFITSQEQKHLLFHSNESISKFLSLKVSNHPKFQNPHIETRSYLLFLGQRVHISEDGHSSVCEATPARNLDDKRDPRVGQDVACVDGEGGEGEDGICNWNKP